MKILPLFVLFLASITAAPSAQVEIGSLARNGRLTFTNAFTNGLYTVEWAPGIQTITNQNGTNVWLWDKDAKDNWDTLRHFTATSRVVSLEVPMYYRVKCLTNLFWPMPLGSSFTQRGSNAIGQVWTNRGTVVGTLYLPSKGKEFTMIELTFSQNPYNQRLVPLRSAEQAMYELDNDCGEERLVCTNAPVGTCWTNTSCGQMRSVCVEAIEDVTVPAGTFPCIKLRKEHLNTSEINPVVFEWWSPGIGLPKWIDYDVDPSEHPPIVYELISLTVNAK